MHSTVFARRANIICFKNYCLGFPKVFFYALDLRDNFLMFFYLQMTKLTLSGLWLTLQYRLCFIRWTNSFKAMFAMRWPNTSLNCLIILIFIINFYQANKTHINVIEHILKLYIAIRLYFTKTVSTWFIKTYISLKLFLHGL